MSRRLRRLESGLTGLRAADFPAWRPELDDALAALPALANCPPGLYRSLAEPRGNVPKRTVLVTSSGSPAAVVSLRSADGIWEPVTTWITPGPPFPCAGGELLRVLHAVGLPMRLAWWRCASEPPRSRRVVPGASEPTYRLPCDADAEAYWRESSLMQDVRKARRRCEGFRVEVDAPDASEWVIRNWGTAWNVAAHHVEDMIVAARALGVLGRYHNLIVYDKDRPIAGATQIEESGDLVGQAVYRDPAYERHSLGTFVIDRVFSWTVKRGFNGLDFGGTASYKERWAPQGGRKFVVRVTPLYRAFADAVGRTAGR
jgi:hypothetical protein